MNRDLQDYGYLQKMIDFCTKFPIDIFDGVVITDQQGTILYANEKHSAFYGRKPEEEIGSNIRVLNKCSSFPHVISTGIPIVAKRLCVQGKEFVGSIVPLKRENKVVGAIGISIFSSLDSLEGILPFPGSDSLRYRKDFVLEQDFFFEDIIGETEVLKKTKEMAVQVAPFDFPILLLGETGTGKNLFAKTIHRASPRGNFPFVTVNCAAIPKDLFETELFGYAPGAFSGSNPKGKPGKFEVANRGTIFLDEIGSLPLDQQAKLLDVLEEKKLERIGSVESIKVDFRLITATSENLERKVREQSFRADLYYRINVINMDIPPLRERSGDIPLLIRHKLKEIGKRYNMGERIVLEEDFQEYLMNYSFPGNLRELFNILEQAVINLKVHNKSCAPWPAAKPDVQTPKKITPLRQVLSEAEREAIMRALKQTRGDVADAAKKLAINRTTLYKKIEKLKLSLAAARS